MTPLPQPRDPGETSAVVGIVVDGLRRLEDTMDRGFESVHQTLARLPNDYVPRREVERWRDESVIDRGSERAERKAEILRIEGCIREVRLEAEAAELRRDQVERDAAKERRAAHRGLLAVTAGTSVSAVGTVAAVWMHFH